MGGKTIKNLEKTELYIIGRAEEGTLAKLVYWPSQSTENLFWTIRIYGKNFEYFQLVDFHIPARNVLLIIETLQGLVSATENFMDS